MESFKETISFLKPIHDALVQDKFDSRTTYAVLVLLGALKVGTSSRRIQATIDNFSCRMDIAADWRGRRRVVKAMLTRAQSQGVLVRNETGNLSLRADWFSDLIIGVKTQTTSLGMVLDSMVIYGQMDRSLEKPFHYSVSLVCP